MPLSCLILLPYINSKRFKIIKNSFSLSNKKYDTDSIAKSIFELNHKDLKGLIIQNYTTIKIQDIFCPLFKGIAYYNSFDWRQGIRFDSSKVYFVTLPKNYEIESLEKIYDIFEYVCTIDNIHIFWVRNIKRLLKFLQGLQFANQANSTDTKSRGAD